MYNPSHIPIQLRLFRKDLGSKHDDVIKIYQVDHDSYFIEYTDNDSSTWRHTIQQSCTEYFTGEQLDTYLLSLFTLLTRDDDPFSKLQVLAAGFPSILLKVEDLKKSKVRQSILDVLPLLTNFWRT